MAVEWTQRLSVGYAAIDDQHRELFRRFNDLLEACQARRGKEKIIELLLFLDEYISCHFSAEEELMAHHHYPGAAEHKEQHRHFVRQFTALKDGLRDRGPSLDLVIETNQALLDWIITHIKQVDVRFGTYLRNRAAA